MADNSATQNKAVEPFLHPWATAYGSEGVPAASNGAVTRSKSIAGGSGSPQMDVCDAYEQTDRSCCSLGWG